MGNDFLPRAARSERRQLRRELDLVGLGVVLEDVDDVHLFARLRERIGDTQLLAQTFLRRFGEENGRSALKFSQEAIRAIAQHAWPGNVRELENRVKRAVIMAEGGLIKAADLELSDTSATAPIRELRELREAVERQAVTEALHRHGGKISGAAIELGISRPTMYELIEKLGLKKTDSSASDVPPVE